MGGWSNVSLQGSWFCRGCSCEIHHYSSSECRRVGRGFAGWEVQERTGERLFRNAVVTFLSHCWKLTEEWIHSWASRNWVGLICPKWNCSGSKPSWIMSLTKMQYILFVKTLWTGIPAQPVKWGNRGAFHPLNDTGKLLSSLLLTAPNSQFWELLFLTCGLFLTLEIRSCPWNQL